MARHDGVSIRCDGDLGAYRFERLKAGRNNAVSAPQALRECAPSVTPVLHVRSGTDTDSRMAVYQSAII